MASRQLALSLLLGLGFAAVLIGLLLLPSGPARALPPAGSEVMSAAGDVSVASRLGTETISFSGTITITRSAPRMEGEVEVVDAEIVSLNLQGQSLTGPVTVSESSSLSSAGEIRSLQTSSQFPASSFFDIFIEVALPVSGFRTPSTVHNEDPLHLVPVSGGSETALDAWPPEGVTYQAQPQAPEGSYCAPPDGPGGIPLLPALPAEICVTNISVVLDEPRTPTPTFTPCPPVVCTPTPTPTPTPTLRPITTPVPTPMVQPSQGPTFSVAAGGPSGLGPADLLGLTVVPVSIFGNDNFANAWEITSLPFVGQGSTSDATSEPGEPQPCGLIQNTVWFHVIPSEAGIVGAETLASSFDTVLAVYTGDSLSTLNQVTCNDDIIGAAFGPSRVTFTATTGSSYFLQAGGWVGATGDLTLNVTSTTAPVGEDASVRIPCGNLSLTDDGCDDGSDGDQDDVDALSFGADFTEGDAPIAFSVAPGSAGLSNTGVALQGACSPAQPQADQFSSALDDLNALVLDGDGSGEDCPTATTLGLLEQPSSDDLNALTDEGAFFIDADGDDTPDAAVFFSLAAGSPSLSTFQRSAADILWMVGDFQPGVYASTSALGLQVGDDIDALCLADQGAGALTFDAALDTILFSLAPGSPTLATLGASPADVLVPGPVVQYSATVLGLLESDDLNALTCFAESIPPATPTPSPTPTPRCPLGDVNIDAAVDSIDAVLVLQLDAGLLASLTCEEGADVNGDGSINTIDAVIILQLDAGLLDSLSPTARPTATATPPSTPTPTAPAATATPTVPPAMPTGTPAAPTATETPIPTTASPTSAPSAAVLPLRTSYGPRLSS